MPISLVPIKFQNSFEKLKTYIGIKLKGQNDVAHVLKMWITKWTENEKSVLYPPCIFDREFARQKKTPQSYEDYKDYQFVPLRHSSK